MSRALAALEGFLTLSESINRAAEAQEWEDLARLGEERGFLLADLPADLEAHLSPTEHERARSIMERCKLLDDETCTRVEDRQKLLRILLRDPKTVN